jgi:hypoxanthine phosphoribosyltransferase
MKKIISINDEVFERYITGKIIRARIKLMARKISKDYAGKTPVFIGVLNGSFIFLADLLRFIKTECEVDFLKLSSYGHSKRSSGKIRLEKDLNCNIEGRDIIVVEDIVDSGLSADFLVKHLLLHKPRSIRIASLLLKESALKNDVKIDYIGFKIPDIFVIGYGLDFAQKARNLNDIYRIRKV